MTETRDDTTPLTVGQVAERYGLTVRTLHHYDAVGLFEPSARTAAGYRLYSAADLERLQHVVVYRRLGFALDEIARLLAGGDPREHLRRQRASVETRIGEMRELVAAIDRALEATMSGRELSREERQELFGKEWKDEYAAEAEARWGDGDAFRESKRRTAGYDKETWLRIQAELAAIHGEFATALRSGQPASSSAAMDLAERARIHITTWYYYCSHEFHRGLAEMYLADPRFTRTYEDLAPGLARYVHDAIVANGERAGK